MLVFREALLNYKKFAVSCGKVIAEDPDITSAEEAVHIGYGTIFEASVCKGRSLGGLTRKSAFRSYIQDYKASKAPEQFVHPALWAYARDAA